MPQRKISLEHGFYLLVFGLALALRLINLGETPLSELESGYAIKALALSNGNVPMFGDNSGYVLLTSFVFKLFEANEFWARFWPATLGSLLVVIPFILRKYIGKGPSLLAGFGLAFDPGAIAVARQAGGEIFSLVFLLAAVGFFITRKTSWCGLSLGMALISGSNFWFGVMTFAFLVVVVLVFSRFIGRKSEYYGTSLLFSYPEDVDWSWKSFLLWFTGGVVLLSTMLFFVPSGLSSLFSGLTSFLEGWGSTTGLSAGLFIPGLLFYESLPLLLGFGAIRRLFARVDGQDLIIIAAMICSLILFVIFPGRQIAHLVWFIFWLWIFGSKNLVNVFLIEKEDRIPYIGMGILTTLALIFSGMNYTGIFNTLSPAEMDFQIRLASIIGAIVLIAIAVVLVTWGWSWKIALKAIFFSLLFMSILYNISALWRVIGSNISQKQEIWIQTQFRDEDLLIQTIEDYSKWSVGTANEQNILVYDRDHNAIRWALRIFEHVNYVETLPADADAAMIITTGDVEISIGEKYTGQDFIVRQYAQWQDLGIYDWLRWQTKRDVPVHVDTIILWVRSDLFPGAVINEAQ